MKDAKEWETGGCQRRLVDSAMNVLSTAPDGASVHACAITIYYSSGVSKIPR